MALDVARRARIGVLSPGAADAVGALDDQQVVDPLAPQSNRGGKSAEASANDDHLRRSAVAQCQRTTSEVSAARTHRTSKPSGAPVALDASRMLAYSVGVP